MAGDPDSLIRYAEMGPIYSDLRAPLWSVFQVFHQVPRQRRMIRSNPGGGNQLVPCLINTEEPRLHKEGGFGRCAVWELVTSKGVTLIPAVSKPQEVHAAFCNHRRWRKMWLGSLMVFDMSGVSGEGAPMT